MFKKLCLSIACLCFTLNAFADVNLLALKKPKKYHFQSQHFNKKFHRKTVQSGQTYYHPQVIQYSGTSDEISCDDLYDYLTDDIFSQLFDHDFYYSGFLTCFDEDSKIQYKLRGFFEPLDEDAAQVSKQLLAELEGKVIYGSAVHFHEAKAIIYNLLLTIGQNPSKDEEANDDFYYYVQPTSLKEHSLQEAFDTTFAEIYENFIPTNSGLFLPLMSKLFGELTIPDIEEALHKGNSVRLIALPMFFYGDDLSIYKDIVGAYFIGEFCDIENRETCL